MSQRYLIVAARFNELITRSLVSGAQEVLSGADPKVEHELIWVPGAYEIPLVAAKAARSGKFQAVITLGAVIRGETPHFDYVAGPCASALMQIGVETGVPVIFGVLTTDTVEQALNRAGIKLGNKGADAAHTALTMVKTLRILD